ncbi:MAG: UvrD-helicase domain-containing protein [Phycisphaeraceae bacterium]
MSEPTAEQRAAIERAPEDKILVNAGAGTGKTFVLIQRLIYLVEQHALAPGSQVLVLSFSRAAVSEVKRRARESDGVAAYSGAKTFDSFATHLLALTTDSDAWSELSYEERIQSATDAVLNNPATKQHIQSYRHLLIDEIQDLVGARAAFVDALLQASEGGISLFGDPAQSIYDHQARDASEMTSVDLYQSIRSRYGSELCEITLTRNFRALTPKPREALHFGPLLQNPTADIDTVNEDLERFVLSLPAMGDLSYVISAWQRNPPSSDIILCRTNGQALAFFQLLQAKGVRCRLKDSSAHRAAPAWIAAAVLGREGAQVSKAVMLEKLGQYCDAEVAEHRWRRLKRLDGRRGNSLDLRAVASNIGNRSLPEELYDVPQAGVMISTIHRAKGLEFDRVFVTKPLHDESITGSPIEEARILYVAITRAKQWLGAVNDPNTKAMAKHKPTGRWCRFAYRGKRRFAEAIELLPTDIDQSIHTDGLREGEPSFIDTQRYLQESVQSGDPIELTLLKSAEEGPLYQVRHQSRAIARTSASFGKSVKLIGQSKIPETINGAVVSEIETVAGSPEESRRAGVGTSGLWLGLRISGLAQLC